MLLVLQPVRSTGCRNKIGYYKYKTRHHNDHKEYTIRVHNKRPIIDMLRRRRSRRDERQPAAAPIPSNHVSSIDENGDDHSMDESMDSAAGGGGEQQQNRNNNGAITPSPPAPNARSTTPTTSGSAASAGRREKRRLFRLHRNDPRSTTTANAIPTPGSSSASASASATRTTSGASGGGWGEQVGQYGNCDVSTDGGDSDTLGSLPGEPVTMRQLNNSDDADQNHTRMQQQSASPPRGVVAPDYVPPPTVPGAVYTQGRALGEMPDWIRRNNNIENNDLGTILPMPTRTGNVLLSQRSVSDSTQHQINEDSYSPRSFRPSESMGSLGGSSHHRRRHLPSTFRGLGSSRRSILTGSVRNLFTTFRSGSILPEAEAIDSERVVYAEIMNGDDDGDDSFCSLELVLYSLVLLLVGIWIGRMTAVTTAATPPS